MDPEHAVRVALARSMARRFGRAVPEAELRRELDLPDVRPLLDALAERGLAFCTSGGWLLTSPPLASRARESCASFAWIHHA